MQILWRAGGRGGCQHSMGTCDARLAGRAAAHDIDEGSAGAESHRRAGSGSTCGQHSLGICDTELAEHEATGAFG